MITANDAMEYLGIEPEYADETVTRQLDRAMKAAEWWLKGAVGVEVDLDDERAESLMLMAIGELYEVRMLTDSKTQKVLASLNRMAGDFTLQLKYSTKSDVVT